MHFSAQPIRNGTPTPLGPSVFTSGQSFFDAIELEPRVLYSASPIEIASDFGNEVPPDISTEAELVEREFHFADPETSDVTSINQIAGDLEAFDDLLQRLADHSDEVLADEPVQMVFIDTAVEGWQALAAELEADREAGFSIDLVILDRNRDGVEQVTEALAGKRGLAAVHLVSHGNSDQLMLGRSVLTSENVSNYADQLTSWQSALSADADLLVYGCRLASTDSGRALLETMSVLCACDVAGSDDATGHADLGGDWALEYEVGTIESSSLFTSAIDTQFHATLATFTVTSTDGTNDVGTLRWAVEQANSDPDADRIEFNIAGTGVHRITVDDKLTISEAVVLDATTQAGYLLDSPTIEIDGSAVSDDLLELTGDNITVRGLSIINAPRDGIEIQGRNVVVVGNLIGLDSSGAVAGNDYGIRVRGADVTIGGTDPNDRNVISGNTFHGIRIRDNASNVNVIGNWIGVGVDGLSDRGNEEMGIRIRDNAVNISVGGTNAGEGNIIAFNDGAGVEMIGNEWGNSIRGNSIYSNTGLAIDLAGDGVTANDLTTPVADNDSGPNRLQNFPVIDFASFNGTTLTVEGDLSGRSFVNYTIDFYATSIVHSSGHGDAQRYLGSQTFLTNSSGQIRFSADLATTVSAGERITATTTHSDGSTSEFSQTFAVTLANQAPVLDNSSELVHFINQNDTNDDGLTVAQWLATGGIDPVTDADGDPEGIAIVSFDDGNGEWQASLDAGVNWIALNLAVPVNDNNAILLDETALLRYVPDPGYVGDSGAIQFRAWDQTDGRSNGAVFVDTTPAGGTTPFSTATETLLVRVLDSIDVTNDQYTTGENQSLTGINVLDNDSFTGVGSGTLRVDRFDATSNQGATVSISSGGDLSYSPGLVFDSLQEGQFTDDFFTYTVDDGFGNQQQATVNIRVNGANDDPIMVDQSFTIDELETNGFVLGQIVATDVDTGPGGDLTFSIVGGTGQSIFALSSSGQLTLIDDSRLDYEVDPSFTLDVEVVDNAVTPSRVRAEMSIDLVDGNASPMVQLMNLVPSVAEDLNTRLPTKVADIVIVDDVSGMNQISLAGPDAALFEVIGDELFLRAGVILDFESTASLDVTVVVDDPDIGTTPDDATALRINIDDVVERVIVANAGGLETSEAGGIAQFEISLTAPPTSTVVVTLASSDLAEGQVETSLITFDQNNWRTPQVVTVRGQADSVPDGDTPFVVVVTTASTDASFDVLAVPSVPVVNRDLLIALPSPSTADSSSEESSEEDSSEDSSAEDVLGGAVALRGTTETERSSSDAKIRAVGNDISASKKSTSEADESAESELVRLHSDNNYRRQVRRSSDSFEPGSIDISTTVIDTVSIDSVLSRDFFDDLDNLRNQMAADANLPSIVVGSVASMASALTVGYVTWLVRGGQLLIGVLGQLPIWRFVDPLPILSEMAEDDEADDQSLANLVDEADSRHDAELNERSENHETAADTETSNLSLSQREPS